MLYIVYTEFPDGSVHREPYHTFREAMNRIREQAQDPDVIVTYKVERDV